MVGCWYNVLAYYAAGLLAGDQNVKKVNYWEENKNKNKNNNENNNNKKKQGGSL